MSEHAHYVSNHLGWGIEFVESGGPVAVMFNAHRFLIPGEPSTPTFSAPIKVYENLGALLAFEQCVYQWIDPGDGMFADGEFAVGQWVTPWEWMEADDRRRRETREMQAGLKETFARMLHERSNTGE